MKLWLQDLVFTVKPGHLEPRGAWTARTRHGLVVSFQETQAHGFPTRTKGRLDEPRVEIRAVAPTDPSRKISFWIEHWSTSNWSDEIRERRGQQELPELIGPSTSLQPVHETIMLSLIACPLCISSHAT